ncbi:MAG: D-glycero-beta-D-manno-heptose 1-phosphate adenylyltransferase [Chitinophagaceae bacterium]|nr:D-glycero-beta-D-manno-heptose 1-phosphate adenylyltransferase [Chitinophagaceae bacterium]
MSNKQQWIANKIMNLDALLRYVHSKRVRGSRIVFTNGCFDILHHGHFDLLAKAANEGDILIVGLNADASVKRLKGNDRPINQEADRALQIASLLVVDAVCFFEEDTPLKLIKSIEPDVLIKGGDYTKASVVGATEVESLGGSVVIIPFVDGYSTSSLITEIKKL